MELAVGSLSDLSESSVFSAVKIFLTTQNELPSRRCKRIFSAISANPSAFAAVQDLSTD